LKFGFRKKPKKPEVDSCKLARSEMFSVLVSPEVMARQLQEERDRASR
jgi:hypothetical protein